MIASWSSGAPERHMDDDLLVELTDTVRRHPWWRARTRLVLALLKQQGARPPARVLDAGCGWGVTLVALEKQGYHAVGLDVSRRALAALDRPGRTLIEADLEQAPPPDFAPADAVLALDVLEHLDDDRAAVERLGRLARPGGLVVVSVPALPELYGEFDRVQGHRRRYRPETLHAAFDGSGLALESVAWWGRWTLPLVRRQRRRPKGRPDESPLDVYRRYLKLPPWPATLALDTLYALEQAGTLAGRPGVGTSLFAVARKPGRQGAAEGSSGRRSHVTCKSASAGPSTSISACPRPEPVTTM